MCAYLASIGIYRLTSTIPVSVCLTSTGAKLKHNSLRTLSHAPRSKDDCSMNPVYSAPAGQLASWLHAHRLSGQLDWSLQVLAEGAQLIGCGAACQARHDPSC